MTRDTDLVDARRRRADERLLASIALGALVVGGIVVATRSPRARKLAWMGAKFAVGTWLPAWGMTQVRAAWAESAPAQPAGVPALTPAADVDHA